MPIGGIGTGSIWLNGRGQLGVWQIFNNFTEARIPDSFLAVRVRDAAGATVTRVLQTEAEGSLKPVESLEFEGGYPIARLKFRDASLPVDVLLEATNPMIPLDAASSSIPCAIFRLTVANPGQAAVEVAVLGTLQNAVGSEGAVGIKGMRLAKYGGNRNRIVREERLLAVAMDKSPDPMASGAVKVRDAAGKQVAGPQLLWLAGLPTFAAAAIEPLARVAAEGGVVLADGAGKAFFEALAILRAEERDFAKVATVFEDFERETYEGWTITGTAFGKGPSHGTEANQQQVSGFVGRGLVNTFQGGDGAQGTATSKAFTIQRRYIGFLIGGGSHPGQTCINLLVDGKVARTTTGKNREALEPASWDVDDLKGKEATIQIVDRRTDAWGHINIDQIVFSDVPPEPLLARGTAIEAVAKALGIAFTGADPATLPAGGGGVPAADAPAEMKSAIGQWRVSGYTRLAGFRAAGGYRALVTTADGAPLIIEGPLGKGRIVLALAPGLPWSCGSALLAATRGEPLKAGERLVPGNPGWGTMALAALNAEGVALPAWKSADELEAVGSASADRLRRSPAQNNRSAEADPTRHAAKQGCCSILDAADARRVAAVLGIPIYVLNFQEDFGRIIEYFVAEYNQGRTPNPCVRCNDWLKFGKLAKYAEAVGADFVASGHYARMATDPTTGRPLLMRGKDHHKDQSYVLFGMNPEVARHTLLPIGDYEKHEVRAMAEELRLPVYNKPDSQEICFVPDQDYAALVRRRSAESFAPGEIVDASGVVVGRHEGHQHFTIGQRRGVGVAFGRPIYVTDIDVARNRVMVGEREALLKRSLVARQVNWLSDRVAAAGGSMRCQAKIRYNHAPQAATVKITGADEFVIHFDEPQSAITPGQAAVVYDGEALLGGGWIERGDA
jgi:tRNA-specific 2-thiouridylase